MRSILPSTDCSGMKIRIRILYKNDANCSDPVIVRLFRVQAAENFSASCRDVDEVSHHFVGGLEHGEVGLEGDLALFGIDDCRRRVLF